MKELGALAKFFATFAKMNTGLKLGIKWLRDGDSDVGYTYRRGSTATVHLLNMNHPMLKGMEKGMKILFITGVFIHELMHQVLTNFVLANKMTDAQPREQRKLFHTVFNILEDSRIEYFASSYFNERMLAALRYTITVIWEQSPDIKPDDETFAQLISAMIQYGDMGLIKGELSPEAEDVFEEIKPLFEEAIVARSCRSCIMIAREVTELLLPYMPEEYEGIEDKTDSDSEGEDASPDGAGTGSPRAKHAKKPGGTSEDADEESAESAPKGESDGDTPAGGDGVGEEGDGSEGDYGPPTEIFEEDGGATEEDFARAAEELEKEVEARVKAESKADAEDASDYDYVPTESPKGDKWVRTISHHKQEPAPELYEKLRLKIAVDAHYIAKAIIKYFKVRSGGEAWGTEGDLNIERYYDETFKSPFIFDIEKEKQKHGVAVIVLADQSGSMNTGIRIAATRECVAMIAESMAEAKIPCMIVGHSGDKKYNCSVEFEHYTTFKNSKIDRQSIPFISALYQNRDGPAIRWCTKQLAKRREPKKLLIVISDGAPCADNYGGTEAIFDTKAAIRDAKKQHDVVGIVIEPGSQRSVLSTMYGDDYVEVNHASELRDAVKNVLVKKAKTW